MRRSTGSRPKVGASPRRCMRRASSAGITTRVGNHDWRYGLSEERRHARKSGADGEPFLDTHDPALRPPRRGSHSRRGGADTRLSLRRFALRQNCSRPPIADHSAQGINAPKDIRRHQVTVGGNSATLSASGPFALNTGSNRTCKPGLMTI
jgi:hypothetical protein